MFKFYESDIKKLKVATIFKKFPSNEIDINSVVSYMCTENGDDELKEYVKLIYKMHKASILMMQKHGFVVDVDSTPDRYSYDTYKNQQYDMGDPDDLEVNYRYLWSLSFRYAVTLYIKRNYTVPYHQRDFKTLCLLSNIGRYLNYSGSSDCTIWKDHRDAMITHLLQHPTSASYAYGLIMPSMDFQLVQDHKNIFNALSNKDAAEFEAILKG